jgi:hypothetical protein
MGMPTSLAKNLAAVDETWLASGDEASLKVRVVVIGPWGAADPPSSVPPIVTSWFRCGDTPVTTAQAEMLAVVAVTKVRVAGVGQAESSMNVAETLKPVSAAVKFAVAEVMFGAAASTDASVTARTDEFSTR